MLVPLLLLYQTSQAFHELCTPVEHGCWPTNGVNQNGNLPRSFMRLAQPVQDGGHRRQVIRVHLHTRASHQRDFLTRFSEGCTNSVYHDVRTGGEGLQLVIVAKRRYLGLHLELTLQLLRLLRRANRRGDIECVCLRVLQEAIEDRASNVSCAGESMTCMIEHETCVTNP